MSVTQTLTYTIKLSKKEETKTENEEEKKAPKRRVTWTEDTVNNEHMNRKKSKRNSASCEDRVKQFYFSMSPRRDGAGRKRKNVSEWRIPNPKYTKAIHP